ncbi:hypothetical protein Mapa_013510 [Marchantia paleacea]|nr:hypothetical protein Mapa_013510 [Marchantia paleacea]
MFRSDARSAPSNEVTVISSSRLLFRCSHWWKSLCFAFRSSHWLAALRLVLPRTYCGEPRHNCDRLFAVGFSTPGLVISRGHNHPLSSPSNQQGQSKGERSDTNHARSRGMKVET